MALSETTAAVETSSEGSEGMERLHQKIVEMGITTRQMVADAVDAVMTQRNTDERAEEIAERDDIVDRLDREAEWDALHLLALPHRIQSANLRFVGSAMKIITDMERIGDHAVNIAKAAHRIRYAGIPYEPIIDLPRFSELVCTMIEKTTQAYAEKDADLAREVIAADTEVDIFYKETRRELYSLMQEAYGNGSRVLLCSHLLFVAHYLERIGDHCTNIAERIVYAEQGKRVPHHREQARPLVVAG
ncbi:MAG: phosphate signaling complex protein PhoU [Armatimonadaceae bacterium]